MKRNQTDFFRGLVYFEQGRASYFFGMTRRFLVLILMVGCFATVEAQDVAPCLPVKVAFYVEVLLGSKDGVTNFYRAEKHADDPGFIPNRSSISLEQEKADYERRRKILVEPILNDLGSRMSASAKSNGVYVL